MAQRVSSTRSVAVEKARKLYGVLPDALRRIGSCRFDGHGFTGAGESSAAVFRAGIDEFQLERGEQVWRGIEIRQGKGIIVPGHSKYPSRERP